MPRKPGKPKVPQVALNFSALVEAVRQVHEHSAAAASRAVNVRLTLRNWAIGCYIVEYEQNCADRAEYGAELLDRLADHFQNIRSKCPTRKISSSSWRKSAAR